MAKPNLASALGGGKDMEDPGATDDMEPGVTDPYTQAAQLIREAIEDGDDESLADALKSFATMCAADGGAEKTESGGKPAIHLHLKG